jgi:hypothetical protein
MRTLIILMIAGIAIVFVGFRVYGWRERQETKPWITYTRLMYAASRCDLYKAEFGVWPSSLAQLRSFRPEFNDWAKDAWGQADTMWGRDFVLIPYKASLGYGELISYGRDGKPGGIGLDRDLEVRFPCDANTNWNNQMGLGLKKPRLNP